jgi:hypothetical protein
MKDKIATAMAGIPIFLIALFLSAIALNIFTQSNSQNPAPPTKGLGVFYVLVIYFITYFTFGVIVGTLLPKLGWRSGVWLGAIPTAYIVIINLTSPSDKDNPIWEIFSYTPVSIFVPIVAACTGAYLGRIVKQLQH